MPSSLKYHQLCLNILYAESTFLYAYDEADNAAYYFQMQ